MIVFYGEFSEESKKYLLKDNAFINFVAGIMGFLIFSIITSVSYTHLTLPTTERV